MATIGQALTAPESGWRRYEDSDSRMIYTGSGWTKPNNASCYAGACHQVSQNTAPAYCNFKFYGTKIRLISLLAPTYPSSGVSAEIDGVTYPVIINNSTAVYQALVLDVTGLSLGVHTVSIHQDINGANGLVVDAIDIDDTGYFVHPVLNQVSSIDEMQIGDCIPCKYVSTSGVLGTFSEIGTCIANEIPVTGTATPNGLFYLIHCGYDSQNRIKLIADRNLQHSISWDTLNTGGIATGEGILFDGSGTHDIFIRLLAGGTSSTDTDNEWDKIIVQNSLNGKITPGDNSIWNWNAIYSWTSTSATAVTQTSRSLRGTTSASYYNYAITSWVSATGAFRPIFICKFTNVSPLINASIDRNTFFEKPIVLTGSISDENNDTVAYTILVNSQVYTDWSSFELNPSILLNINLQTDSSIEVLAKDIKNAQSSILIGVIKKSSELTHIDSVNPDSNYLEIYNKINSTCDVLSRCSFDTKLGYILTGSLNLNVKSGTLGTIHIGLIDTLWTSDTVTYNTKPTYNTGTVIDYTISATGMNSIDITALLKKLQTQPNYGIYITSTDADLEIDVVGNSFDIVYLPTSLKQPEVVYGNRCTIAWNPFIFPVDGTIQKVELWRDTDPNFGTEVAVFSTSSFNETEYLDNNISYGTYYYRLKSYKLDAQNNVTITNSDPISIQVPNAGYKNVLTDPINIVYTTQLADGLSFDDPTVDYNFYTTPDKIRVRPLDMGTMIGGRTQNIFAVEVINSFTAKNFDIYLRAMTTDTVVAEEKGTYGLLYDSGDPLGRTRVELDTSSDLSSPQYPLMFTLNAGQRQVVYIRVTPTIYNTVGSKQIQIKLTGRPL